MELNKRVVGQVKDRFIDSDNLMTKKNGAICFVPVTQLDISATKIREQWQQNRDSQFFLPDSVLKLIQQQNIY